MQTSNRKLNWQPIIVLSCAGVFFAGALAYWYTDGFDFLNPPPPPVVSRPTVPKPKTVQPETVQPQAKVDAGTLRVFTQKQAELEQVKLDVAIAEQNAKLKELIEGKKAAAPLTLPVFAPPPPPAAPLQPLQSASLPELPTIQPIQPMVRSTGLISIQGMDSNLSAVVMTSTGRQTLKVGDSYLGSRIQKIDLDGLTLRSGKVVSVGE